ncbi:ABC transporter ATP-binding protein [Pseudoalteromonas sp. OOF1S-7]|uniref:ABC transporter ATP-binding protein n=1 Tax=Pseudoalteromonas sp. OOF1S-7 TaxID=2917757 RepID=UPI001EF4F584|nr:ABC transporter ATP-binding protein [Pseudoalteromonas sp. OOF1S-7]MCG7536346.1 ABC transporter ATP-binding protein/permease [Pseudoalteromonas sp. OOF1S-7]
MLPLIKLLLSDGNAMFNIGYFEQAFTYLSYVGDKLGLDEKGVLILFIITAFMLKAVFSYFAFGYAANLRAGFILNIRQKIIHNLRGMSYEDYVKKDNGEFINIVNEQSTRAGYCFYLISQFYSNMLISITFLIATFYISYIFGSLMLLTGVLVMYLFRRINQRVLSYSRTMVDNSSNTASLITQFFTSFKYLKVTNNLNKIESLIHRRLEEYSVFQHKTGKAEAFTLSIREPFLIVSLFLISYLYLAYFEGSAESLLISTILIYKSVNSFFIVQRHRQSVLEFSGGVLKVKGVLAESGNMTSDTELSDQAPIRHEDAIVFDNVKFKYKSNENHILKGVSFSIKRNTSVAFIGASGSGKTTIIDLISNLLEPCEGQILYDGQPVKGTCNRWQDRIGYVTQSPYLYDDSIARNITMTFDAQANEAEHGKIIECAKNVHSHDFIMKQNEGYETRVGENGITLSGGQKQRIALAREFYADPSLLIFDEATSALDSETESIVNEYINSLKSKKTIIVIAHRISTIKNVDKIFVLKDGEIVEEGTYMDLTENEGSYLNKLISKQLL